MHTDVVALFVVMHVCFHQDLQFLPGDPAQLITSLQSSKLRQAPRPSDLFRHRDNFGLGQEVTKCHIDVEFIGQVDVSLIYEIPAHS